MEKYSIELTRDELVRVIEGLGLLMDEAQEEQDKEKRHNACVLRRQLLAALLLGLFVQSL